MSTPLLIPIENQVRELDPKLLLATCAAKAGIKSYLGYRTEIDINISSLPRAIYLAKSFTQRSDKMFRILSKLGHTICAWDEEALVHYPPDIYFKRRLSPTALSYVSHLFTWGQDNEDLFRSYRSLPKNISIHKVGNPRLDMLREEFSYYYQQETQDIGNNYGDFILINTNFGNVNAHLPMHNLFTSKDEHGNYKDMGRGATGMGREFSEGRAKYKQTLFDHFQQLIPFLADQFKDKKIIIRPHPVENKDIYNRLAAGCDNVEVIQQGNVIPWIRAALVVIHNGCTTGIEAYLSKQPAIAYVPIKDARHGYDAELPNSISHQCHTLSEVESMVQQHIDCMPPSVNSEVISKYITFDEKTLCCEKMVSSLHEIIKHSETDRQRFTMLHGLVLANKRKLIKRIKSLSSKSKYHHSFQQVRFPTLQLNELQQKLDKFAQIIDSEKPIMIKQVSAHIFLVQ